MDVDSVLSVIPRSLHIYSLDISHSIRRIVFALFNVHVDIICEIPISPILIIAFNALS